MTCTCPTDSVMKKLDDIENGKYQNVEKAINETLEDLNKYCDICRPREQIDEETNKEKNNKHTGDRGRRAADTSDQVKRKKIETHPAAAAAQAEESAMEVEANAPTPSPTLPTSPSRTGDPSASSTSSGLGDAPTLPSSSPPPPEAPLVVVSSVPSPAPARVEEPRRTKRVRKTTSQWRPADNEHVDQWARKE